MNYEQFVKELNRLYLDEDYDGDKKAVLFVGEHPEHYRRWCEEEGLTEDEEE
jgi:hypothetical protein